MLVDFGNTVLESLSLPQIIQIKPISPLSWTSVVSLLCYVFGSLSGMHRCLFMASVIQQLCSHLVPHDLNLQGNAFIRLKPLIFVTICCSNHRKGKMLSPHAGSLSKQSWLLLASNDLLPAETYT